MLHRETGLQELFNRVKAVRQTLNMKTFVRNPTKSVEEKDLLCVFMLEERDEIVQRSSRGWLGYPVRRELEVVFELIALDSLESPFDIRAFYRNLRSAVLKSAELVDGCSVRETRAIGPRNYGRPNVIGMQMVLAMTYTDNG